MSLQGPGGSLGPGWQEGAAEAHRAVQGWASRAARQAIPAARQAEAREVGGPPHPHPWILPASPHSIIRGVNQDRFIQRAVEAANAYSSILQAVRAAEGAAGQAQQQASRTWAVRP